MNYLMVCQGSSTDISTDSSGAIVCTGTLTAISYSPTLGELPQSDVEFLTGEVFIVLFVAFGVRQVIDIFRNFK